MKKMICAGLFAVLITCLAGCSTCSSCHQASGDEIRTCSGPTCKVQKLDQ